MKTFTQPPAPSAPAVPTDLASELAAYDAAEPVKAEAAPIAKASTTEETTGGADAFLSFLEQDLPKPVHHH